MRRFESYYLCQVRHRRCAGCGDRFPSSVTRGKTPQASDGLTLTRAFRMRPRKGKRHSGKTLQRVVDDGKRKAYYRREGKMLYSIVWHRQVSAGGSGRKTITVLYIFSTKNAKYIFGKCIGQKQTTYFYR